MSYKVTEIICRYTCDNCGEDDLEFPFWCSWDVELQKYVIIEPNEAETVYCNVCEERVDITMSETDEEIT